MVEEVSEPIDVSAVVGESAEHVVIGAIAIAGVMKPVTATGMMVGVEAGGFVTYRQTIPNHVARDRIRQPVGSQRSISTRLEAIAIGDLPKAGVVTIVEGPAILERHGLVRGDAIIAVITIEPRPAAAKDIVLAAFGGVAAEAIHVPALAFFGCVIPVIPGIAIEEKIVRPLGMIDADGLPIVHGKLLEDVMASGAFKTNGLGMSHDGHLHAGYFQSLQMQPRAGDIEGIDPPALGLDVRAIEDRPLLRVGAIGNRLSGRTAFVEVRR